MCQRRGEDELAKGIWTTKQEGRRKKDQTITEAEGSHRPKM